MFIRFHIFCICMSFVHGNIFSFISDLVWYRCQVDLKKDIDGLVGDLTKHVYGQPLVTSIVTSAIKGHFVTQPTKPLVLSFHGWPGSGKNHVADIIAKNLYYSGGDSRNVHLYIGKKHFPVERMVADYQVKLRDDIKQSVERCPYSLFIFDEVDKIPKGVLDAVKPFLDYHRHIDGVDYRWSIFIFLSNVGGNRIVEKTLELWKSGVQREDYELKYFENLLTLEAFNDEGGGFFRSSMIESHLVDHYVPFLPLTREHVYRCVERLLQLNKAFNLRVDEVYLEVLEDLTFGPDPESLFSVSGCKRISPLVKRKIAEYRLGDEL